MGNPYELRKFVAPELIFGEGAHRLIGRYAANFRAKKVLIVTDAGVRSHGWTGRVERELCIQKIPYAIFDGLTPNPKDDEVQAGFDFYRSEGCDVIVAVGGGSVIDCAKGISILSTNQGDEPGGGCLAGGGSAGVKALPGEARACGAEGASVSGGILRFAGVDEIANPGPPLLCVPTTAGSSADVSQFSIILDRARQVKVALISKLLVPDVALIDPLTTTSMPPELTAATGVDALVHGVEAYVSNASSTVTDPHALEAIRLVCQFLPGAIRRPQDMAFRAPMMAASMHAGLAFSNASLGLVHAMAHSLGGSMDLAHGECNAILLEYVIQYNYTAEPGRYRQVGRLFGVDLPENAGDEVFRAALVNAVAGFRREVGLDRRLGDLGVTRADLHRLAENALADPCLLTNPLQPTLEEIEEIYERAL